MKTRIEKLSWNLGNKKEVERIRESLLKADEQTKWGKFILDTQFNEDDNFDTKESE